MFGRSASALSAAVAAADPLRAQPARRPAIAAPSFLFTRQHTPSLLASLAARFGTRFKVRASRFVAEQRGVSLVETILAVGILGLSLTAALNAFSALAQSAGHLDRATAADAVANSVAESILNQAYLNYPLAYSTTTDVANPRAYTVAVQMEYASDPAGVTQTTAPTWTTTPLIDYGLQRITITVTPAQGGIARVARIIKRR